MLPLGKKPFEKYLSSIFGNSACFFSRLNCGRCTNNHPYNRDLGKIKKYIFLDDSTKSFNFYNLNPVDLSYNFSYDTGNKDDIIMATPSQFIRFLNLFHFYFMLKLQNQAY